MGDVTHCGRAYLNGREVPLMRAVLSLVLASAIGLWPSTSRAQPECSIAPVFTPLRDAIGADVIGTCAGPAAASDNGDLVQPTSQGLLVLRIIDGVPLFTDGSMTWLFGPEGLQTRSNAERFPWEHDPITAGETTTSQASPTPTQAVPSGGQITGALDLRCHDLVIDSGASTEDVATRLFDACQQVADAYGARGVDCYEDAVQAVARDTGPTRTADIDQITSNLSVCLTGEVITPVSVAPTPIPTPPPTATPVGRTEADPVLMSKCVSLAVDLTEELNPQLPRGSSAGGRAFQAFLGLCQLAVKDHGEQGYSCFEKAFHRAIRMNARMPPGSTLALDAANAEYKLCVGQR